MVSQSIPELNFKPITKERLAFINHYHKVIQPFIDNFRTENKMLTYPNKGEKINPELIQKFLNDVLALEIEAKELFPY